jgi:ABC-type bacteriocin/lantibiotic exporter with double-glycine peptidase domain
MLINTVANMGLTTPLVVLSLSLFFLLLLAGGLNALRIYILDVFGRRFYARMVSEISLRTIYAPILSLTTRARAPCSTATSTSSS